MSSSSRGAIDIDECNTSSDVCTTTGTNCENTLGSFHCVRNTSSTITLPVTEQQTVQKTSVTPVSQLTSSLQGQTAVTSLPSSPEYNKRPPTRSASTTSNVPLTAGTAIITVGSTSLEMTEASISHLSTAVKPHISISLYPNFSRYLSATETATSTNEEGWCKIPMSTNYNGVCRLQSLGSLLRDLSCGTAPVYTHPAINF